MGRIAPIDNAHKKRGNAAFFILSKCVGTAVPNLALRGFPLKSPLKIRKNFPQTPNFILVKLLKFQETFPEKFLVSGFGADAPTFNATKKRGNAVLFIFRHYMLELRSKPCFKGLFEKSPLKIRKNFSPNNTTLFWRSF